MSSYAPDAARLALFAKATHVRVTVAGRRSYHILSSAEKDVIYKIRENLGGIHTAKSVVLGEPVYEKGTRPPNGKGQYVHHLDLVPLIEQTTSHFVEVTAEPESKLGLPADLALALAAYKASPQFGLDARGGAAAALAALPKGVHPVEYLRQMADKYGDVDAYAPPRPAHAIREDLKPGAIFEVVFDEKGEPLPDNQQTSTTAMKAGLHYGTRLVLVCDDGTEVLLFKRADGGWLNGKIGGEYYVALSRLRVVTAG